MFVTRLQLADRNVLDGLVKLIKLLLNAMQQIEGHNDWKPDFTDPLHPYIHMFPLLSLFLSSM
jgi:hypothetical protein